MLSCIINYWPQYFRNLFGGALPRDYCVIDCETTGFAFERDVITEWGHVLVEDGKVTNQLSLIIDWTQNDVVPDAWLRSRLNSLRQSMALSGSQQHITYERMKSEGVKPKQALTFVNDFTRTIKDKGILFVGHNIGFDERMICANLMGFQIAPGFTLGHNGFLDTDGIAKASQCLDNVRMHPCRGDTLRTYFHRVRYSRVKGIKSNLSDHCWHKYGLDQHGIAQADLHGAKVDAYCTHLLFETFRGLLLPEILTSPSLSVERQASRRGIPVAVAPVAAASNLRRVRGQRNN